MLRAESVCIYYFSELFSFTKPSQILCCNNAHVACFGHDPWSVKDFFCFSLSVKPPKTKGCWQKWQLWRKWTRTTSLLRLLSAACEQSNAERTRLFCHSCSCSLKGQSLYETSSRLDSLRSRLRLTGASGRDSLHRAEFVAFQRPMAPLLHISVFILLAIVLTVSETKLVHGF